MNRSGALDVQTRQLMENELLELWQSDRKSVIFITHDLEEAISMSDRVIVLLGGAGHTSDRRSFLIDLPRPRDVSENSDDAALSRTPCIDLGCNA
ncbi:MAG: hypothetical protein WDN48_20145 [Pseudolabrys sp.]